MDDRKELAAFEKLLGQHEKLIMRVVQNQIQDSQIREDVFQEACLRLFRNYHKLVDMGAEQQQAHVVLITRYAAIDYYRSIHKGQHADLDDETLFYILGQKEEQENNRISELGKIELKMLLNHLSPEERLLIVGKYYLGYSITELTKTIGGTKAQVKSKLQRAKKRLAEKWSAENISMEDFFDG